MRRVVVIAVLALLGFTSGWVGASPASFGEELSGRGLFERRWVAHDRRSPSGDGLGPMHNATSCLACHHLAGSGGAGSREHNVDLISVVPLKVTVAARDRQSFIDSLIAVHPGFRVGHGEILPNFVLHRFGPEADYFALRARVLGIEEPRPDEEPARRAIAAAKMAKRKALQTAPVEKLLHGDVTLQRSQRNTPALWGAGLIDSIPDTVIEELAASQAKESSEISGRAPRATGGGIGRFGWRGQTQTLRQFVLAACANELGLQTKGHEQAPNPLAMHYKQPGDDLSAPDADALVAFVANLPRPHLKEPRTPDQRDPLRQGAGTFERIGCAACHRSRVGRVEGLFSDLLLHDMGSALEDPVEPNPPTQKVAREGIPYSGGGIVFVDEEVRTPELAREWRTPPLWGVADSAPYLHDGRAATLADAIKLHGGEAALAAKRFQELTSPERAHLILFLQSLVAPSEAASGAP